MSQNIESLDQFLNLYPWGKEYEKNRSLDFLWTYDVKAPIRDFWNVMIDTSRFNERMGLPPMEYEEKNGKMFGKTRNAGIAMEWEEVPWEWEYCKTLSNARIYSKGFAKYVRSRYVFCPISETETRLLVYFGWIPRHKIGALILKIGMPRIQKAYRNAIEEIEKEIQVREDTESFSIISGNPLEEAAIINKDRLDEIRAQLLRDGCDAILVDKFLTKIQKESENDLYRIQIKKIAMEWNRPYREILKIALYGCKTGLLTLSWDLICPHCRGVRKEIEHLGEIPESANCDVCDIDFSSNSKNSVEITFHIHPSIREIRKRYFCAAEPATKRHIYLQKVLEPNTVFQTSLNLDSGIYRMRVGSRKQYNFLEIDSLSRDKENPPIAGELELDSKNLEDITHSSSELNLSISNPENNAVPFVIESREEDRYALRPGDLLNYHEFRNIFSEEFISDGITLDIGTQTILFTDIVGSTKLYQNYGDSKAFTEVRKHFVEIYRIIQEYGGVVVKTIGDSVMASFYEPSQSIEAAIAIQEFFQDPENSELLKIRISIHHGTCLAVNFNNGIDYFGNTVNYASKLQKYSGSGDIVISDEFFSIREVKKELKNIQDRYRIKRLQFGEKWGNEEKKIAYRVHVPS